MFDGMKVEASALLSLDTCVHAPSLEKFEGVYPVGFCDLSANMRATNSLYHTKPFVVACACHASKPSGAASNSQTFVHDKSRRPKNMQFLFGVPCNNIQLGVSTFWTTPSFLNPTKRRVPLRTGIIGERAQSIAGMGELAHLFSGRGYQDVYEQPKEFGVWRMRGKDCLFFRCLLLCLGRTSFFMLAIDMAPVLG